MPSCMFRVFYSMVYIPSLYSKLYIPCFVFQGLYSRFIFQVSYSRFYIPRFIFQVYIPSFIFQVLYSKVYIPVSILRGVFEGDINCDCIFTGFFEAPEAGGTAGRITGEPGGAGNRHSTLRR